MVAKKSAVTKEVLEPVKKTVQKKVASTRKQASVKARQVHEKEESFVSKIKEAGHRSAEAIVNTTKNLTAKLKHAMHIQ